MRASEWVDRVMTNGKSVLNAFSVDVEFKKPVLLPTTVVFGSHETDTCHEFGIKGAKKPVTHLVGRVSTL